jgi:hypothetical protein
LRDRRRGERKGERESGKKRRKGGDGKEIW